MTDVVLVAVTKPPRRPSQQRRTMSQSRPTQYISAVSDGPALGRSDTELASREELELALGRILSREDARETAGQLWPERAKDRIVGWNEHVVLLVALLSSAHRERVKQHYRWSEAELQRRIDAAQPAMEALRTNQERR